MSRFTARLTRRREERGVKEEGRGVRDGSSPIRQDAATLFPSRPSIADSSRPRTHRHTHTYTTHILCHIPHACTNDSAVASLVNIWATAYAATSAMVVAGGNGGTDRPAGHSVLFRAIERLHPFHRLRRRFALVSDACGVYIVRYLSERGREETSSSPPLFSHFGSFPLRLQNQLVIVCERGEEKRHHKLSCKKGSCENRRVWRRFRLLERGRRRKEGRGREQLRRERSSRTQAVVHTTRRA